MPPNAPRTGRSRQVAGIGDPVQGHDQRFLPGGASAVDQVIGVGVVIGRIRSARPWCTAPPVSRSSSGRPASIIGMPASAASRITSRTRSSESIRWPAYKAVAGTLARNDSSTELRRRHLGHVTGAARPPSGRPSPKPWRRNRRPQKPFQQNGYQTPPADPGPDCRRATRHGPRHGMLPPRGVAPGDRAAGGPAASALPSSRRLP